MKSKINWTNVSVRKLTSFVGVEDPIESIETRARDAVLQARDNGWNGPPFDPIDLAEKLGLTVEARSDIPDARTVPRESGLVIQYNPMRPRGRLRFSIAHEIAHSFFPDCADAVRNRGGSKEEVPDDWQLEVLCNIGAAELLMPSGSFPDLSRQKLTMANLQEIRKKYDVSTEALLIRIVKLSNESCAVFCSSKHGDSYKIDYVIPSHAWKYGIYPGFSIPSSSLIYNVNAIGYSESGQEAWADEGSLQIECIALSPYLGQVTPRIVGILKPVDESQAGMPEHKEVIGSAIDPRGSGTKIIAHIVPDKGTSWGGRGFAATVKKTFPAIWVDFCSQISGKGGLRLGDTFFNKTEGGIYFAHMVAQHGFGPSPSPRIRYTALESSLKGLAAFALENNASVHMPKIGTGQAGGDWNLIKELLNDTLIAKGIEVTVYSLP